jgi:hypothetical protein
MKKLTNPCDFVGRFFFSFKNDELQWQGQIISKVSEGIFLVCLHEWTTGQSSSQVLFSVPDMMGWKFYDTAEDWRSALTEIRVQQSRRSALTSTQQGLRHPISEYTLATPTLDPVQTAIRSSHRIFQHYEN